MHGIRYLALTGFYLLLVTGSSFDQQTGSRNFVLHHDRSMDTRTIERILEQLETDYVEFRQLFNLPVRRRTPVILHRDVLSFTNSGFVHPWEWGTVQGGEIHLSPSFAVGENVPMSVVLTQQVVRLILYAQRLNGCPRWLYEGAAGYYAGITEVTPPPVGISVQRPADLNEIFSHAYNEREFIDALYLAAWTFSRMIRRYGEANVVTLLRLFNGEFLYEQAVPFALGVTVETFERQWLMDIQQLLPDYGVSYE